MIKIGLCDDDDICKNELSSIINNISKSNDIDIELTHFNCGEELIDFCNNHQNYFDILFLDIIMDGINGINTAKLIRSINLNTYILFLTSSPDYALDSYSVNAYSYILKPFFYNTIEEKLLDLYEKLLIDIKNTIYVKNNQDIHTLRLDNVIYFESNLRKIIAYMANGDEIAFYNKMSDLEKEINSEMFVRCHRSFLVNLSYIKSIVSSDLYTIKNHIIPISKKYLIDIRIKFTNYIKLKLSN